MILYRSWLRRLRTRLDARSVARLTYGWERGAAIATSWEHVAWMQSESDPRGPRYEIKRHPQTGRLGCSCAAYRFSPGDAKRCKHIGAFLRVDAGAWGKARVVGPLETARTVVDAESFTVTRRSISFGGKLE